MIHPIARLIGRDLRCRALAHAGEVLGFVVDGQAWALRYVQVHLAGDPAGTVRLLPCAAFPPVTHSDGTLPACLTADELGRGLELAGPCESLDRNLERVLHDRLHWMPYWTPAQGRSPGSLHDAALAIGARMRCAGEPFGYVDDLIVDTSDWTLSALTIATGESMAERRLHLPVAFVRGADWAGRCFDSDVRAAALACAPRAGPTTVEAGYLDEVRRHLSRG